MHCSYFFFYRTYDEVHSVSKDALAYLVHNEFIEWSKAEQKYRPTKLASATVASALAPEEGLVCFYLSLFLLAIFSELNWSVQHFA